MQSLNASEPVRRHKGMAETKQQNNGGDEKSRTYPRSRRDSIDEHTKITASTPNLREKDSNRKSHQHRLALATGILKEPSDQICTWKARTRPMANEVRGYFPRSKRPMLELQSQITPSQGDEHQMKGRGAVARAPEYWVAPHHSGLPVNLIGS